MGLKRVGKVVNEIQLKPDLTSQKAKYKKPQQTRDKKRIEDNINPRTEPTKKSIPEYVIREIPDETMFNILLQCFWAHKKLNSAQDFLNELNSLFITLALICKKFHRILQSEEFKKDNLIKRQLHNLDLIISSNKDLKILERFDAQQIIPKSCSVCFKFGPGSTLSDHKGYTKIRSSMLRVEWKSNELRTPLSFPNNYSPFLLAESRPHEKTYFEGLDCFAHEYDFLDIKRLRGLLD